MLSNKDRIANFFITKNFENCFIGDENHPELGKKIFLLYKYQATTEFVKFESRLLLLPDYNTDYDYFSERKVMFVFDIPEEHEEDFKLFLEGKYSKFSDLLKQKITNFWGIKKEENLFVDVVNANDTTNKTEEGVFDTAEGEYWPKPVLSREIYMNPN